MPSLLSPGRYILISGAPSGRLYALNDQRVYQMDGLGRVVRSSCWEVDPGAPREIAKVDRYWGLVLRIQYDEEALLKEKWWRNE